MIQHIHLRILDPKVPGGYEYGSRVTLCGTRFTMNTKDTPRSWLYTPLTPINKVTCQECLHKRDLMDLAKTEL